MKPITEIFSTKSILEDGVNCWLQYVLAQPIEIDLKMFVLFMIQYSCIPVVLAWIEQAKPLFMTLLKFSWDGKLIFEKLTLVKA